MTMRNMRNLLAETIKDLEVEGLSPDDVRWVGVRSTTYAGQMPVGSWADFARFADFEYHAGYGGNEVQGRLVIVGDDWWLERGEYDGSEWWEFKTLPQRGAETIPLRDTDLHERN